MITIRLKLTVINGTYSVCRLPKDAPIPGWALQGQFSSATRTANELSVVCPQEFVPAEVVVEKGWRCLVVEGPLGFSLVGILASLVVPLAEAQVSVFALSTYDTDYIFVKERYLEQAVHALSSAGHLVSRYK